MSELFQCPTCHHESNIYWKRITELHVDALIKLRKAIGHYNRNDIRHLKDLDGTDFELTHNQKTNWSVLRQFGLITHVKDEDGKPVSGHWLLTKNGAAFLKGEYSVPAKIKLLNNHKLDETPERVSIKDIRKSFEIPYFDDLYSQEIERQPIEIDQTSLLDLVPPVTAAAVDPWSASS